jgi:hypothetical protein
VLSLVHLVDERSGNALCQLGIRWLAIQSGGMLSAGLTVTGSGETEGQEEELAAGDVLQIRTDLPANNASFRGLELASRSDRR